MKKLILVLILAAPLGANADLIKVDFEAGGPGKGFGGTFPFGLDANSVLTGSFLIDSSIADGDYLFSSIVQGFTGMTGSMMWDLSNIGLGSPDIIRILGGHVVRYGFDAVSGSSSWRLHSFDTTQVRGPGSSVWACNDCNSATSSIVPVPEPGTLTLFGIGLLGLGLARRKAT